MLDKDNVINCLVVPSSSGKLMISGVIMFCLYFLMRKDREEQIATEILKVTKILTPRLHIAAFATTNKTSYQYLEQVLRRGFAI